MSLLEKLCKELGVEIGEEWTGIGVHQYPQKYTIHHNTLWKRGTYGLSEEASMADYVALIKGGLKPAWKPKEGDIYYIPIIKINKDYRYGKSTWLNDDIDQWYLSNNMVFKTKEEAIAAANKMLEFIKIEFIKEER